MTESRIRRIERERDWFNAVDRRDLLNPRHVQELFELAVRVGFLRAEEPNARLKFFAAVGTDLRLARQPKAMFRQNVLQGRWYHTAADVEFGRVLMSSLGSGPSHALEGGAA